MSRLQSKLRGALSGTSGLQGQLNDSLSGKTGLQSQLNDSLSGDTGLQGQLGSALSDEPEKASNSFKSTLGSSNKLPDVLSGIIGGLQRREHGGAVNNAQPYLVGEKGPELVIPENSGVVIPNDVLSKLDKKTLASLGVIPRAEGGYMRGKNPETFMRSLGGNEPSGAQLQIQKLGTGPTQQLPNDFQPIPNSLASQAINAPIQASPQLGLALPSVNNDPSFNDIPALGSTLQPPSAQSLGGKQDPVLKSMFDNQNPNDGTLFSINYNKNNDIRTFRGLPMPGVIEQPGAYSPSDVHARQEYINQRDKGENNTLFTPTNFGGTPQPQLGLNMHGKPVQALGTGGSFTQDGVDVMPWNQNSSGPLSHSLTRGEYNAATLPNQAKFDPNEPQRLGIEQQKANASSLAASNGQYETAYRNQPDLAGNPVKVPDGVLNTRTGQIRNQAAIDAQQAAQAAKKHAQQEDAENAKRAQQQAPTPPATRQGRKKAMQQYQNALKRYANNPNELSRTRQMAIQMGIIRTK